MGFRTAQERYVDNLHLLGDAFVDKTQHVARMTWNSDEGPM